MKSPKMPTPSKEEIEQQQATIAETRRRERDTEEQRAKRQREFATGQDALAGNRVGVRSLLSGDWGGFQRGGDLGPKP